ncbi:hypothetical protein GJ744_002329 [Endocarpon pusillum]|uniref:Uncharacterized protein n=1 Tax=Endocarpon pusillum TaxID=364733 RepID=A0A8H7ASI4_9EURO|nr:hypothetical protein GJ744_002329 [Endocarpon pusillum]
MLLGNPSSLWGAKSRKILRTVSVSASRLAEALAVASASHQLGSISNSSDFLLSLRKTTNFSTTTGSRCYLRVLYACASFVPRKLLRPGVDSGTFYLFCPPLCYMSYCIACSEYPPFGNNPTSALLEFGRFCSLFFVHFKSFFCLCTRNRLGKSTLNKALITPINLLILKSNFL